MVEGDDRDGYMGWSFYTGNDPKFQGAVADFKIYERAMTDEQVEALYDEVDDTLAKLKLADFGASAIDLTVEDLLGENASADSVSANLVLPSTTTITVEEYTRDAEITKWTSSNPDVITDEGVVKQLVKDMEVTMTASVTFNGRTVEKAFDFVVPGNPTDEARIIWDSQWLTIPNMTDIRGNITLPSVGDAGSTITWESSNEDVIRTTANGEILPGQVTRQAEDTPVTLTATIDTDTLRAEKTFECVVKADVGELETTDYLFAYFPYAGVKDERIYFGISEDGLNFEALNDSKPVLESVLGTHGLRDPFIIRSPEGDRFFLIATDLTVAGIEQDGVNYPGMSWGDNQRIGSKSIMIWESTDLVNWSEQRMVEVAAEEAGCTWAPEAYWDDATGQYAVFWASMVDGEHNLYMATTRDFYTFSEPKVWIDENGSVIDTTVIKAGEYYYRYTKNEAGSTNTYGTPSKRVYCERSRSLTATEGWELCSSNSLNVSGGQIEGATIFKLNTDDVENAKEIAALKNITLEGDEVYCLAADMTGNTVFPGLATDITTGAFSALGTTANASVNGVTLYSMPEPDASHGTIMPITSEEYVRLRNAYDQSYVDAVDAVANAEINLGDVSAVTGDLKLPTVTSAGDPITWTSSNEAVVSTTGKVVRPAAGSADEAVELTATFTIPAKDGVRAQEVTKTITVTVKAQTPSSGAQTPSKPQTPQVPAVSQVKVEKTKLTLGVKESYTVVATALPANAKTTYTYKTSNQKVATVDAKGKIKAKKAGKANITVTSANGKSATIKVTVKKAPGKITVTTKAKSLKKGKSFKIKYKLPKNTASNKITFKSSNKKVATVDANGKVKALKKGKATITVKTFNGKTAKVKVTVK